MDDDEWTEELVEESGRIEARLDEIEGAVEARAVFRREDFATARCIVTIGNDGALQVIAGLVKPEDMPKRVESGGTATTETMCAVYTRLARIDTSKVRQPWLFGLRDGTPLVFAGLWERWTVPEGAALTGSFAERSPGDAVETCTILTTAANETVAPVHGRMPVILPEGAYDAWLAGEEVPLAPYPAGDMTAYPVSTLVNKPAHDDPRYVEPVVRAPDGG